MKTEKLGKIISWIAIAGAIGGFLVWAYFQLSQPLPGQAAADLGRGHVVVGTKVEYNSNPPTSGPHYAEWTRAGIYDEPIEDGYLIHSLEHGYIIISYNCERLTANSERECGDFKARLKEIAEDLGIKKLIVIYRPALDVPLALTAWAHLLKLEAIDEKQIRDFVNTFRNAGPEQTME